MPHNFRGLQNEGEKEENDDRPTIRTPSTHVHLEFDSLPSTNATSPSLVKENTTFADMARRFNRHGDEIEDELSNTRSVSLAGIIKLQPNRKKVTGAWRSMQASDLVENDSAVEDDTQVSQAKEMLPSSNSFPVFRTQTPYTLSTPSQPLAFTGYQRGLAMEQATFFETPLRDFNPQSKDRSLGGLQSKDTEPYEHIFGKLSDPIRLHEQTGQFDGQVVFIAHPNRDISAHQWSSTFFQWVNIGRYAHFRGRVEGSLASDRLKELSASQNPLEFFKLAAETREKLIKEHGRQAEASIDIHQPTLDDVTRVKSAATISSLAGAVVPTFKGGNVPNVLARDEGKPSTPAPPRNTVRREPLEDPFIAPAMPSTAKVFSVPTSRADKNSLKGSLDFSYEFPLKSIAAALPVLKPVTPFDLLKQSSGKDKNKEEASFSTTSYPGWISESQLRDIDFGEEATSSRKVSTRGGGDPPSWNTADNFGDRSEPGNGMTRPDYGATWLSGGRRMTLTDLNRAFYQPDNQPVIRNAGLTVANPHRYGSGLNASAVPFTRDQRPDPMPGISNSVVHGANATSHALRFSDPDSQRRRQEYEIANGLSKQPPTEQNFKGPFFTDTMPTANDPTMPLSVRISEDEKLMNWFRDGHRPARQQEYARTLMSAAASANRPQHIGVIGQGLNATQDRRYENTPTFVRLYENLSEYAEEHRKDSGRSYFTRAWKIPKSELINSAPGGNNSFFETPRGNASRPATTLDDRARMESMAVVSLRTPVQTLRGAELNR